MHWIIDGLAVCLVSMAVTGIIIPQILLIAFRKKLFDEPDERKIHTAAVPRLGGIAFMPSIVFSLCLVLGLKIVLGSMTSVDLFGFSFTLPEGGEGLATLPSDLKPLFLGMSALMMMYLVGMADDLIGVRYRAKFVAQILAALLLVAGGVCLDNLHVFLGLYEIPFALGCVVTVVLIVFIINAINLIDGIDGLASGLSAIAMAFYAINFLMAGRWVYSLLAFAGLGTLVPFFYYNVFGNPAMGKKIFMGDTGSLTTGFILAYLAFETVLSPNDHMFSSNILVVAFAPLAIPSLDVLRVFVHRLLRGNSPFLPDKSHIHHKLLALGIPQRQAMVTIVGSSALLILANLWMANYMGAFPILAIDLVAWIIGNWLLTKSIHARQKRLGIEGGYN